MPLPKNVGLTLSLSPLALIVLVAPVPPEVSATDGYQNRIPAAPNNQAATDQSDVIPGHPPADNHAIESQARLSGLPSAMPRPGRTFGHKWMPDNHPNRDCRRSLPSSTYPGPSWRAYHSCGTLRSNAPNESVGHAVSSKRSLATAALSANAVEVPAARASSQSE